MMSKTKKSAIAMTRQGLRDLGGGRDRRDATATHACDHVWDLVVERNCLRDQDEVYRRCGYCHEEYR